SASSVLTPRSWYDSLMCSYWRSRLGLEPRGMACPPCDSAQASPTVGQTRINARWPDLAAACEPGLRWTCRPGGVVVKVVRSAPPADRPCANGTRDRMARAVASP